MLIAMLVKQISTKLQTIWIRLKKSYAIFLDLKFGYFLYKKNSRKVPDYYDDNRKKSSILQGSYYDPNTASNITDMLNIINSSQHPFYSFHSRIKTQSAIYDFISLFIKISLLLRFFNYDHIIIVFFIFIYFIFLIFTVFTHTVNAIYRFKSYYRLSKEFNKLINNKKFIFLG